VITLFLPRRRLPSTIAENPLWLIVLCDLMTNLMLFFLVMYSFTLQTPSQREKWARTFAANDVVEDPKLARARVILRQFREAEAGATIAELLVRAGLGTSADVSVTQDSIRVRLRNHVLFPSARAELTPEVRRSLAGLARVLREMPNEIIVEGHTDNVPIASGPYRTNWELSVARANSVIARLIVQGIPPERLIASGYGPHHPIADNGTAEGRGRNRRVEIVIIRGQEEA
jgi:chemotaxis protein MotB